MTRTNFALNGSIGTPLMDTTFHLHPMPNTNSSLSGMLAASLVAAAFHLPTMPNAQPSTLVIVGASLVAAAFHLHFRTMPNTNSSLWGILGTRRGCIVSSLCHA